MGLNRVQSTISFTKMHGIGNDYLFIDDTVHNIQNPQELAQQISHRRFGVGSDGLVLISKTTKADAKMRMFNADGSESLMCGNALRCVGRYLYERGWVSQTDVCILLGNHQYRLRLDLDAQGVVSMVGVDMGIPQLAGRAISAMLGPEPVLNQWLDFEHFKLRGSLVFIANPHLVTFVESLQSAPVTQWGPIIEEDRRFSERINVEFAQILNPHEVRQRTWERGSGETWACGSGAVAVCVAGILNKKLQSPVLVHLTGGDLKVNWDQKNSVHMAGPAEFVFEGQWAPPLKD